MSLRDGTKKMSKSDPSEYSLIALTDDADAIAQKFRKAKTDADALPGEVEGLAGRPEAENLVGIFAALDDQTKADVLGASPGPVFEFQERARRAHGRKLGADPRRNFAARRATRPMSTAVLAEGARKAREIASPTMDAVKDILGLVR